MENEENGCFNPVIVGPVMGVGCALIVVMSTIIGVFLLSLMAVA